MIMRKGNTRARVRKNLVQRLEKDLRRHRAQPGEQLSPIRELAGRYEVSYVTMRHALLELQEAGVVELRHGAGVFMGRALNGNGTDANEHIQPDGNGAGRRDPAVSERRVGLVLPEWAGLAGHEAVMLTLRGFMEAPYAHSWRKELIYTGDGSAERPEFVERVLQAMLDAVVWLRPRTNHQMNLVRLADRGVYVAACGRRFPGVPYPTVSEDVQQIARDAVDWCVRAGKTRLALLATTLTGSGADPSTHELVRALQKACAAHPAGLPEPAVCASPMMLEGHEIALRQFLSANDADAYICLLHDYMTPLAALAREGFWPEPRQKAVVDVFGHGGTPMPTDFGGLHVVRGHVAHKDEGAALAQLLQSMWTEGVEAPPLDYPVRFEELAASSSSYHS